MAKKELAFEPGDHIVYPSHGVGRVRSVETEIIAGFEKGRPGASVSATYGSSGNLFAQLDNGAPSDADRLRYDRTSWRPSTRVGGFFTASPEAPVFENSTACVYVETARPCFGMVERDRPRRIFGCDL